MTVQFVNEYTPDERKYLEIIFKNAVRDIQGYHSNNCVHPCDTCPVKRLCRDLSLSATYLTDYEKLRLFKSDKEKVTK